ncbi:MAG: molybdopterin-dependent oxidoreductase [Eggerthellaceae bacterium]|nr:molybdopterin-dependent oxidoreductase [Eggerthellaceae bacterium]
MGEESFVYTACPGWGDHDYCALKTIVKDGKIERMERIEYSEPERVDGHICQKGCLAGRQPYDPARLRSPLKRKGERGSGQWEEISWDQALDEIGAKLCEIRDTYGPQAVTLWNLGAGVPAQYSFENLMPFRFANTFGVTVPMGSIGLDNGPFYAEFYNVGDEFAHTLVDPRIVEKTDLIYVWGCNPIENQMRCAKSLVAARENGARIVDVGLIFDATAGFADEFVGVKPASDGYLAMAMVNYILANDLQASDYLLARSIAAYLVDCETGQLARDEEGNFCVWDNAIGAIGAVAPAAGAYPSDDIALFRRFDRGGKEYATTLQILKERAAEYTFELAAEKTGLSVAAVERFVREWVEAENAFILSGYGLRYRNSNETYRQFLLLGCLTGRLGRPGSGVIEALQLQSYPLVFNDLPISCPDGPANVKSVPVRMHEWFAAAESKDSPYKALIVCSGNPVHQQPDRQRWLDVVRDMELVVDYDVWLTDTGEIADYVLPDCMSFEREDLITGACYNHLILQEPAIEPQGDCHEPVWVFSELARRVGLGDYFTMSIPEYIDVRLQTQYPLVSMIQPPVTYERLKAEKIIRAAAPPEPKYTPYLNPAEVFSNATGRMEIIYAERLAPVGLEVTRVLEPNRIGKSDTYPFQLFTGRQRFFMQSSFTDDPITVKLSGENPATRLNPADAERLGLSQGDKVEVYNERGHVVTRLDLDESIPQGTVHVWFGWRRRQFEEGTYAEITAQCAGADSQGPAEDKWFADWLAAGHHPNPYVESMSALTGSTDCYWDSWCNIRAYAGKEA